MGKVCICVCVFISVYLSEPMAAPSNVQVNQDTVTDTEAEMSWVQVDLSPESIRGYFRGYRVCSCFMYANVYEDEVSNAGSYVFLISYRHLIIRIIVTY